MVARQSLLLPCRLPFIFFGKIASEMKQANVRYAGPEEKSLHFLHKRTRFLIFHFFPYDIFHYRALEIF